MKNNSPVIIFTGGHHTSALAVARRLQSEGVVVLWLGHRHSMWNDRSDSAEFKEVTLSGIPFYNLMAGKFYRTIHPLKLIRIPIGFIQSFWLLLVFKVKYWGRLKGIFSSGGYLAVPVVFCGWLLSIPSVTHEQTAAVGLANQFLSRFVKKIALSWPDSTANFPVGKTIVTGLPLRPEIQHLSRHPQSVHPLIFIMGGKQGSHIINEAVFASLNTLRPKYRIIHQVGSNSQYQDIRTAKQFSDENYHPYEYLSTTEISDIYQKCSVVVGRSGAHTVYEMAFLGIPCVFIPIPWSSHKEQLKNAQLLVSAGQAVLLFQDNLSPDTLTTAITAALALHPGRVGVPADGLERVIQLIKHELLYA